MKKIFFFLFILLTVQTYSQNWGIGARIGDPTGFTIKKYFGSNALELSFGRTYMFAGKRWYDSRFDTWYKNKNFTYSEHIFENYASSVPIGLQLHYLFQKSIKKIGDYDITNLDWYFGFGGQMRFQHYTYEYEYRVKGDPNWYVTNDRITEMDFGVDGVIGLEYKFAKAPIAVFTDFTLAMELYPDPFLPWGQFGIGVRYDF